MKKNKLSKILIIFLFLGCVQHPKPPEPDAILATIDGTPIKEDALRFELNLAQPNYDQNFLKDPQHFNTLKRDILNRMIQNQIILNWGAKQDITLSEEEKAKGLEKLKEGYSNREFELMLGEKNISLAQWSSRAEKKLLVDKIVHEALSKKPVISPQEVESYYENHEDEFTYGERIRVRQIVTDTLEKAQHLYKMVTSGQNFAKVAILYSLSPDRSNGGDLGFFSKGTYPKEFDDACFDLNLGEISPIIKSPYGFHIFKMVDKKPAGVAPLDEVEDKIIAELAKKRMMGLFDQWFDQLHSDSQIQIMMNTLDSMKPWEVKEQNLKVEK